MDRLELLVHAYSHDDPTLRAAILSLVAAGFDGTPEKLDTVARAALAPPA